VEVALPTATTSAAAVAAAQTAAVAAAGGSRSGTTNPVGKAGEEEEEEGAGGGIGVASAKATEEANKAEVTEVPSAGGRAPAGTRRRTRWECTRCIQFTHSLQALGFNP
jgi:hypothetical protein